MEPDHPIHKKSPFLFLSLLAVTILFYLLMRMLQYPLQSGEIVAFEIARTAPNAQRMLGAWEGDLHGKLAAMRLSVYLDFVFIVLYGALIISATRWFGFVSGYDLVERASRFFRFIALAACVCDIVENMLMLRTLNAGVQELVVRMTYNMAAAKFSLLIMCVLFLFFQVVFVAIGRLGRSKTLTLSK